MYGDSQKCIDALQSVKANANPNTLSASMLNGVAFREYVNIVLYGLASNLLVDGGL